MDDKSTSSALSIFDTVFCVMPAFAATSRCVAPIALRTSANALPRRRSRRFSSRRSRTSSGSSARSVFHSVLMVFLLQPSIEPKVGFSDQLLVKERLVHTLLVPATENNRILRRVEREGETPELPPELHPYFL